VGAHHRILHAEIGRSDMKITVRFIKAQFVFLSVAGAGETLGRGDKTKAYEMKKHPTLLLNVPSQGCRALHLNQETTLKSNQTFNGAKEQMESFLSR
jgi:hypothetical protein